MSADPHLLTGAYAADALSGTERLAFERHLHACPPCAEEARALRGVAARLGAAVASPAPAALWARVRAEVATTDQVPPVAVRVGRRTRPLLAAAAALLVVAVSVTALGLSLAGGSGRSAPAADPVAAVLAAPDARRVAARAGGAGRAEVVVSRQRGRAVLLATGLAPAPAARTYQLWVVDRSGPRPAGLVEVPAGGRVTRLLDGRVTGSEQVAMTVERRGGAARPTSEPVMVVSLSS
ncbi:MAG TPA: anti-sigma factor [Actinomycetota bacterium]|nr:anti-sigma factor [Actinomycetota bacterium]